MEKIDVHSGEPIQEKYNMILMLRVFNKLDEIVEWTNAQDKLFDKLAIRVARLEVYYKQHRKQHNKK